MTLSDSTGEFNKVLIIEDDTGICNLIFRIIRDLGNDCITSNSFAEAEDIIEREKIFLIVMDYSLPDMNGTLFIKKLLEKHATIPPFIVTTGVGDERIAVEMMKLGARDYLIKDMTFLEILPEVIKRIYKEIDNEKKLDIMIKEKEKSDYQFKFISENIGDGITLIENDIIIFRSPAFYKIIGFNCDDIGKPSSNIFNIMHPDDIESVKERVNFGVSEKKSSDIFTYRILRNDGKFVWLEDEIRRKFDDDGSSIVIICTRDITERKNINDKLLESLNEKEILLKEIHHRVKNNLQIITSLLSLQGNQIKDTSIKNIFFDIQNRIRAMAMIHEHLYRSTEITLIDFYEYLKSLLATLSINYGNFKIEIDMNIQNIFLNIDSAIPCGLIINELITNTMKYAFKNSVYGGKVNINMSIVGDNYFLTYRDNGVGLPDDIIQNGSESLGLTLVNALVQQLNGGVEIYNENGANFNITFPKI